ncbi:hypothetical protein [Microbacterium ulmi]|uniref:Uncharacterized protein n=1 Tax=Microbacterium ulmi TaxID=179095 RepID=A0A7Y2M0H4_9MICO|nr:hypothetical protein [Microbacterium ulmi]NII69184.1 hypothetical protein [Microbacterium ulmi]NNH03724.1 hypothetical protein [Microbacterium ulmi]
MDSRALKDAAGEDAAGEDAAGKPDAAPTGGGPAALRQAQDLLGAAGPRHPHPWPKASTVA